MAWNHQHGDAANLKWNRVDQFIRNLAVMQTSNNSELEGSQVEPFAHNIHSNADKEKETKRQKWKKQEEREATATNVCQIPPQHAFPSPSIILEPYNQMPKKFEGELELRWSNFNVVPCWLSAMKWRVDSYPSRVSQSLLLQPSLVPGWDNEQVIQYIEF